MAEHEPPADLLDKLRERAWGRTRETFKDHPDALIEPFATAILDDHLDLLVWLAEWADGKLIDPSTWTRVTAARLMCPVHGSAACPEEYMLKEDGTPWAHYASYWHESMRCGRRPTLTREDP